MDELIKEAFLRSIARGAGKLVGKSSKAISSTSQAFGRVGQRLKDNKSALSKTVKENFDAGQAGKTGRTFSEVKQGIRDSRRTREILKGKSFKDNFGQRPNFKKSAPKVNKAKNAKEKTKFTASSKYIAPDYTARKGVGALKKYGPKAALVAGGAGAAIAGNEYLKSKKNQQYQGNRYA